MACSHHQLDHTSNSHISYAQLPSHFWVIECMVCGQMTSQATCSSEFVCNKVNQDIQSSTNREQQNCTRNGISGCAKFRHQKTKHKKKIMRQTIQSKNASTCKTQHMQMLLLILCREAGSPSVYGQAWVSFVACLKSSKPYSSTSLSIRSTDGHERIKQ